MSKFAKLFLCLSVFSCVCFAADRHLGDGVYLLDEQIDPTSSIVKVTISDEQIQKLTDKTEDVDCNPAAIDCNINELTYQKELKRITKELIYSKLNNDFDFIFYVLNSTTSGHLGFTGRMHPVRIDYKNLSLHNPNGVVDFYEAWGSGDKLKGVFYLPIFDAVKNGPSLHEFAHHWGVSCVDELNGHWEVSSAGGQLGGFKYWKKLGNNQYQGSMNGSYTDGFGRNGYGNNFYPYSDIELYLMGFKSAKDLRNENFVLDVFQNGGRTPSVDGSGKFTADAHIQYTIDDITANFDGKEREPGAATSQKKFKILTIFLSRVDTVGQTVLKDRENTVVEHINWFAEKSPHQNGEFYNFYQATGGIGSIEAADIKNSLRNDFDDSNPDPNTPPLPQEKPKPANISVPDIIVDLEESYSDTFFNVMLINTGGERAQFGTITISSISGEYPSLENCGIFVQAEASNNCPKFGIPNGLASGHYEEKITVAFSGFGDMEAFLSVNVGSKYHGQGKQDDDISIKTKPAKSKFYGVFINNNPVTDVAKIFVSVPEKIKSAKITVIDNAGNIVYTGAGETAVWNLTNKYGRKVANGSYPVIAEAVSVSGAKYRYSTILGVKN